MWNLRKQKSPQTHRCREQVGGCQSKGVGEKGEGGQKVQNSSCKINKSWGYIMVTIVNNTVLQI